MKYNGTQFNKQIPAKLCSFFEASKFCDCTFKIDGIELKAHKLVLTCFSPVFEKMFYGPLASAEVTINDIDVDIFQQLLLFMYYEQIAFENVSQAWAVYSAANKYCIKELMDVCLDYIQCHLSLDSLALSYEYAEFYSLQDLKKVCFEDMICYFRGLLLLSDYHMKASTLTAILKESSVEDDRQYLQIANGVINWAVQECQSENINATTENVIDLLERHKLCQFLSKNCDLSTIDNFDKIVLNAMKLHSNYYANITGIATAKRKVHRLKICKLAERIDFDRDYEMSTDIMSNKRLAIFALVLNTAMAPPTVVVDQQEKSYFGSITIRILKCGKEVFKRTNVERTFPYGSETLIDLNEVVIIERKIYHQLRISYSVSNQYLCSVNRYYGDKFEENDGELGVYGVWGTVLRGICYYPV